MFPKKKVKSSPSCLFPNTLISLLLSYATADLKRHPLKFALIAVGSALLAAAIALLSIAISQSPLVFLRFAENRVGETDIIILPSPQPIAEETLSVVRGQLVFQNLSSETALSSINIAQVRKALGKKAAACQGCIEDNPAPRWIAMGAVGSAEGKWHGEVRSYMMAIDTELERKLEIGRSWDRRAGGKLEAYMSEGMTTSMGISGARGMRANFTMSLSSFLQGFGILSTSRNDMVDSILRKTGMDLGLPIGISDQTATLIASDKKATKVVTLLPNSLPYGPAKKSMHGGSFSIENENVTVFVPTEVLSNSFSRYLNAGAAAKVEFTIIDVVSAPDGKWPKDFGNVVVVEASQIVVFLEQMIGNVFSSSAFTDILRSDLDPFGALTELVAKEFRDRFLAVLRALDVQSAAPLVGIQSIDRTTTFAETDQTARQSFAQFTDSIGERIGPDAAVSLSSPLLLAFEEIDFLQVVLHQFFIVFVFIFAAIGCVVLWTTSSAQVQELSTTSEIMRTLGMPRSQVQMFGCLISLRYLVVGIVLGTLLTGAGLLLISKTLSKFLRMPARAITFVPVLLAVVLGVVVPCLGSLLPCSRIAALSSRRNPRQRIGKKESSIIVKRLQNFGWNVSVLAAASIMTIYGAVFYFFLPKSFLEEDYSLFFGIMNISVTGIILGLVFILQPLQECVQYVFAFIFVSIGKACNFIGRISTRSERCLFSCVRRNMKNHRRRNRDAALVLSFSMALLMFAWSFTKVQIVGITESIRESLGSDIVLTARDRSIPLNETLLREHMKDLSIQNVVKKFTFITFPLFKKLQVTGIAEWPISEPLQVYGIDKYFFETVFQDITILSRNPMDPDSDETLFQLLQKSRDPKAEQNEAMLESKALNTIPVSLSEGFRNVFALESSSVLQLRMQSLSFMATAPILVEKLPAFIFSKFASTISTSPLVVSEASFRRFYEVLGQRLDTEGNSMLLEESMNKEMSPKQRLLILLQPGSSTRAVKDHIQMFGTDRLIVRDIEGNLEEVYGLEKMLMAVNAVSLIMLSLLSGSMLFVVFHENGKAANWEMGLLRALGLTNKQVFQILSYEYVSLTLSGLLSGSTVGIVASFVLVLQDELFRGIRQKISFPFLPNVILCFASLLTAMISTALAWRKICSSEACAILRGG